MKTVKGGTLEFMGNVSINDNFINETYKRIVDWVEREHGKTLTEQEKKECMESAKTISQRESMGRIYKNNMFTVNFYNGSSADDMVHHEELKGKCVWLSIKRNDKTTRIEWFDKMQIVRALLGDDWMGMELYPPQKFMVDTANQYHIICIPPEYVDDFPFGWKHREINSTNSKGGYQKLGQTYRGD